MLPQTTETKSGGTAISMTGASSQGTGDLPSIAFRVLVGAGVLVASVVASYVAVVMLWLAIPGPGVVAAGAAFMAAAGLLGLRLRTRLYVAVPMLVGSLGTTIALVWYIASLSVGNLE
jgi:hypothetical protein